MKFPLQHLIGRALLLGGIVLSAVTASGQITLNSVDRGWYDSSGNHDGTNDNYLVGLSDTHYRDFFVFDRSLVAGTVLSAELRLFLPTNGFLSQNGNENLFIYKVATPIATLTAGGTGLTSIYNDLGDGSSFGSRTIAEGDENSYISITLNNTFLSYLNNDVTGQFALGGRITTLGGSFEQYAFGYSGTDNPADGRTQLVLTTSITGQPFTPVPEPSTYGMIGAGLLLGLAVLRRRKKD